MPTPTRSAATSSANHLLVTAPSTAERNTVKVPADVPLELLSPIGCGFLTGAGTVLNAVKPRANSTVVILGAGALAFSALFAAKIAGVRLNRRGGPQGYTVAVGEDLGADEVIDTSATDLTQALKALGAALRDRHHRCSPD